MKLLRKNIDLDNITLSVLQIEAMLNGYGTLKPYLEKILADRAKKSLKERPDLYKSLIRKLESKPELSLTQKK